MANPYFNAVAYLQKNPDVMAAGYTVDTAEQHYLQYGANEALLGNASRNPAPYFDVAYYLDNNADLIEAGIGADGAFAHFVQYGQFEGRSPSQGLTITEEGLEAYAAANPDLQTAFDIEDPTDLTEAQQEALTSHYYQYGYYEGRPGADFEEVDPENLTLTVGIDNIVGSSADDTISGPVAQNQNGELVNTFETGDTIDGGAGQDTLNVVLTNSQGVDNLFSAPAISATVSNVEVINARAQYGNRDIVNFSHIDAELHAGVEEYWSDNSRADLQIEDIRQLPEELTFGMRQTDPESNSNDGASFYVYFDPAQLAADRSTSGDSSLTLTLVDNTPGADELENFPVNGIVFTLGGTEYTVQTEDALGATYAEFAANLQAALAANPDLADVTVTLNPNNSITLVDPEGEAFEPVGYTWVGNVVPSDGNLQWNMSAGAAIEDNVPVTTNVVLDAVGRTSQGGELDIGSMADGGVEVFNVSVDRDSWVSALESREYFGVGDRHLETINLTSIGANGDLAIGEYVGDARTGALDGRVENGLTDVREVLNQGFEGDLSYGVVLTEDSIARYLDDAEDTVQFTYEGGNGADNITIYESDVSGDDDFAMSVDLGASDDRLNLTIENASNVSVDGGEGSNTIAVASSHGTDADNTFAAFANFQTYEVERFADTVHNFESMQGVTAINVATLGGADTTLINVARDADVVITGKNQTLATNSNSFQVFGDIAIDSAEVLGGDNTLGVTLQNTARLDAGLIVSGLTIGDIDGDVDGIRTLNLVSAGSRDTFNVLFDLDAALVNTFNLTGTQDLFVDITAAANSTAAAGLRDALVVNGADLAGSLDLDLTGDMVSAINAASKTVTLTGTANEDDVLGLDGALLAVTNNTTVSAFETVEFWNAAGTVNVSNFNGVGQYRIESATAAGLEISGMKGNEKVWADADAVLGTLTFVAAAEATTNVLDIEFVTDQATATVDVEAQAFRTIQLDLGGDDTANAYTVNLTLLDDNGDPEATTPPVAGDYDDMYARTLVITGGGDDGAGAVDSVDLGDLVNVYTTIDLSDYVGTIGGTGGTSGDAFTLDTGIVAGRNVTIELNGYGAEIDERASADNIVTYVIAEAVGGAWSGTAFQNVVSIEGFDLGGTNALQDVSVLDVRALDISQLSDFVYDYSGGDLILTDADNTFAIELVGVTDTLDLTNENFIFAA